MPVGSKIERPQYVFLQHRILKEEQNHSVSPKLLSGFLWTLYMARRDTQFQVAVSLEYMSSDNEDCRQQRLLCNQMTGEFV